MKTIAELNHHIRNALQVIRFLGGQQRQGLDAMQLQLINDSVDRIEWALREVLAAVSTRMPGDYPARGAAQNRQALQREWLEGVTLVIF